MADRSNLFSVLSHPDACPASDNRDQFLAFLRSLPNTDKMLSEMLTPELKADLADVPLQTALKIVHRSGLFAVRGRKSSHADRPLSEAKPGRPLGVSNIDWGSWPGEVAEFYKKARKDGPTKAEAVRRTCAEFGVDIPVGKALERRMRTLDAWTTRIWTQDDQDAWEARQYDKLG